MYEIKIYKGWILYRAEIDCPGAIECFYGFTRKGTIKRAHSYLDRIHSAKQPIETIWYDPDSDNVEVQ